MSSAPITTIPSPQSTSHQQDVLNDFVDFGHRLLRRAVEQTEADTLPVAKAAIVYDRITRNARRCILLIRKLAEPITATSRVAARKQIIRTVEDAIQRDEDADAETLHAEMLDRLDTLDLEDEIGDRPVEAIITDILRDLGLAHIPGTHPWKRRTPRDLAKLSAHAQQPAKPRQHHQPPPATPTLHSHPARPPVGCNST
jgi:hypothetical protein